MAKKLIKNKYTVDNNWQSKNASIIITFEWLIYVFSLIVLYLNKSNLPSPDSQLYVNNFLTTNLFIFFPLLFASIIAQYVFSSALKGKNPLSIKGFLGKARLFWLVMMFVMMYAAGRSAFIMLVSFGFNPCNYDWKYCIRQYYSTR